ncbi:hypothetical protein Pyn_38474 [Prunus yedoensis var. nudiflora]|uniref:Uncharacterized protein n=1 Tax=Prunus yedoensis var. nudiflora TaxID=2094558 RepID=A0A314YKR5_PRUYE|nr:hypothetical protein Pyn_38474 [Prunus yedoensis var. nudiflora]
MTCQFNEDGRAWHGDPTTTESNRLSTLVTSVVKVTALTKVGGKALTIARMTTAYHVQSDNCCHGLKMAVATARMATAYHVRGGGRPSCPGWRPSP